MFLLSLPLLKDELVEEGIEVVGGYRLVTKKRKYTIIVNYSKRYHLILDDEIAGKMQRGHTAAYLTFTQQTDNLRTMVIFLI